MEGTGELGETRTVHDKRKSNDAAQWRIHGTCIMCLDDNSLTAVKLPLPFTWKVLIVKWYTVYIERVKLRTRQ